MIASANYIWLVVREVRSARSLAILNLGSIKLTIRMYEIILRITISFKFTSFRNYEILAVVYPALLWVTDGLDWSKVDNVILFIGILVKHTYVGDSGVMAIT